MITNFVRTAYFSHVRRVANQALGAGVYTTVQFDTVDILQNILYNSGTYVFNFPVTGIYFLNCNFNTTVDNVKAIEIYDNTNLVSINRIHMNTSASPNLCCTFRVTNTTINYIIRLYSSTASTLTATVSDNHCYMELLYYL